MVAALGPYASAGATVVGLEPSCLFSLRDEFLALLPDADAKALAARARTFEEFVAAERAAGRFAPALGRVGTHAVVHTHCHQKAFGAAVAVKSALEAIPGLAVEMVDAGCCGMAGPFGYQAEHYAVSMRIGELGPLPAMRAASAESRLVAPGTSCRHQIAHGAGRTAVHPALLLAEALV